MTFLPLRCRVDSDCRHSFPEGSIGEDSRTRHEAEHRKWKDWLAKSGRTPRGQRAPESASEASA